MEREFWNNEVFFYYLLFRHSLGTPGAIEATTGTFVLDPALIARETSPSPEPPSDSVLATFLYNSSAAGTDIARLVIGPEGRFYRLYTLGTPGKKQYGATHFAFKTPPDDPDAFLNSIFGGYSAGLCTTPRFADKLPLCLRLGNPETRVTDFCTLAGPTGPLGLGSDMCACFQEEVVATPFRGSWFDRFQQASKDVDPQCSIALCRPDRAFVPTSVRTSTECPTQCLNTVSVTAPSRNAVVSVQDAHLEMECDIGPLRVLPGLSLAGKSPSACPDCSGNGVCVVDRCLCRPPYDGPACATNLYDANLPGPERSTWMVWGASILFFIGLVAILYYYFHIYISHTIIK